MARLPGSGMGLGCLQGWDLAIQGLAMVQLHSGCLGLSWAMVS